MLLRSSFFRNLVIASMSFAILQLASPTWAIPIWEQTVVTPEDNVICQFPINKSGDLLLVPVLIEGKRYEFIIDTGATTTALDKSLLTGQPQHVVTIETPTGSIKQELFDGPVLRFGKIETKRKMPVVAVDLALLRQASGYSVMGVIGLDILSQYVIRLDFKNGMLEFLKQAGKLKGEPFQLTVRREGVSLNAHIKGLQSPISFLVDTGTTIYGSVNSEIATTLEQQHAGQRVEGAFSAGVNGVKKHNKWLIHSLSLGNTSHPEVVLIQSRDNILGLGFLSQFELTLDFAHSQAYLVPSPALERGQLMDRSGLHLLRIDGYTMVHSIDQASRSAVADIKEGDRILSINNVNAEQFTMLETRRLLSSKSKLVNLLISRGGIILSKSLNLAD
ncbi:MAG: aspartyl protease family protein [Gemmatales bacterium]